MMQEKGFLLADDMGLGKTIQTIAMWQGLRRPYPCLIMAPASTRRGWVRQFRQWLGLEVKLVETGKQAAECDNKTGVIVTSYELAMKLPTHFYPHMCVIDEAQNLRGRRTKRGDRIMELMHAASHRMALTGTPMWSRPRDLWNVMKMLFGYRFGTAESFDFAYCAAYLNAYGGRENSGSSRADELALRLPYVMLRRTKEEVAKDLPSLTRAVRWLPPDPKAKRAMEAAALGTIRNVDALKSTLAAKIDAAVEVAQECDKFILFTWMKADAHTLQQRLIDEGIKVELITGDLTHKQRETAIDRAIADNSNVVATIDSCGAGVDRLQHVASNVIFHSIDYVPTKTAQAEARAHRIGQDKPVFVTYLALSDSADQWVIEKVVDKLDQWRQTMGNDSTAQMHGAIATPAAMPEVEAQQMKDLMEMFKEDA
jgi:SWI/SNF-related matrix-associated actin-dependent regulator 1 of chromatin subfamily A